MPPIVTILQHPILINFAYPFLLLFLIVYGVLEKTKILGEGKAQLNAFLAFIIGLIFVGAVFPKEVVSNLILFLTVALVAVFVALILWGFATGGELKEAIVSNNGIKWTIGIVILITVIIATSWAVGGGGGGLYDLLFSQDWSSDFWTNFLFIVVIGAALAAIIKSQK